MSDKAGELNADDVIGVTARRDYEPMTAAVREALKKQPAEQRRYVGDVLQRKQEQSRVGR